MIKGNVRSRRRGSMYVVVLGTSVMVTVIGLSALLSVRVERREVDMGGDFAQARLHAQSAIEIGLARISDNPDWRTRYSNGVWEADRPIGTGTYTVEGFDADDADLGDDDTDPLVLTGTGFSGDARYKLEVTLVPEMAPLSCLEVAMHVQNDAIFNSAVVAGDQTISANNNVSASSSTVNPDVEAVSAISGTGYAGTTTPGITPRAVPDPATVFEYYVANGTAITVPSTTIEGQLLSPSSNPYGLTDPQGIYVLDCLGQDYTILRTRIVGTLVLLNAGASTRIQPEVNLEPAVANFPSLLVEGNLQVETGASSLSESALGINFNPPGTPYQGTANGSMTDSYPAVITGLVYVSGDITTNIDAAFEGVVVGGASFTGTANVTLNYNAEFFNNPPPGFRSGTQMRVSAGSWRRAVD